MSAAHRTLLHTRAANVQSYKPHAMEETYYCRCIAGDQLQDHRERDIGVLNPSDTNPFHPVLHDLRSAIQKNLNRQALNRGQLLTRQMINQGIAAQAIYGDFLRELSHWSHLYSPPLTGESQPRSPSRTPTRNPRQRFSAVASDRRPRHPISPMRDVFGTRPAVATTTDAAAHPHHLPRNKHKRYLDKVSAIISSLRSEFSDDAPKTLHWKTPTTAPNRATSRMTTTKTTTYRTSPTTFPPLPTNQPRGLANSTPFLSTARHVPAAALDCPEPSRLAEGKPTAPKGSLHRPPGMLAPSFIDSSSRPHSRPKLSAPIQLPRPLDGNSPPQRDHFINYHIQPVLSHTLPAPAIPTEARRAQCLTVYLWANWV